jgi:outer membrane protein OmpA-like peptidoglycan-associated protein
VLSARALHCARVLLGFVAAGWLALAWPLAVVASDATRAGVEAARAAADAVEAALLAPEGYARGVRLADDARKLSDAGRSPERADRLLAEAEQLFAEAATLAERARGLLDAAWEARTDALTADASRNAPRLWQDADGEFSDAARRLERGRDGYEKRAAAAEAGFREAELASIEVVVLSEIDRQIEAARKLDADDYAPRSLGLAVELVAEARARLAADRYDTDQPRSLALLALHHARHAEYVARLGDKAEDSTLETVLLEWQAELAPLGDLLDMPLYYDEGAGVAADQLAVAVAALQRESEARRTRVAILEDELSYVRNQLAGQTEARARLDARLAEQARRDEKVRRIETMFQPDEAQVLRSNDRLVIRLVGLGFTSGRSEIEPRHQDLIDKLERALAEFPETPVVIEGHTDSYGVDSDNLALSIARAEAVAAWLLANTPISPIHLTALGYGETRPIANNETDEGRSRNRRIDVVLYPQL